MILVMGSPSWATTTDLPTGSPLRMRFLVEKEATGLELLALRFDLRFRQGRKDISLNPFKPTFNIYGKAKLVMSDEFIECGVGSRSGRNRGDLIDRRGSYRSIFWPPLLHPRALRRKSYSTVSLAILPSCNSPLLPGAPIRFSGRPICGIGPSSLQPFH